MKKTNILVAFLAGLFLSSAQGTDKTPQAQHEQWAAVAGRTGDVSKDGLVFNQKHGDVWPCASCYNSTPIVNRMFADAFNFFVFKIAGL